jgi:hypothetical protein
MRRFTVTFYQLKILLSLFDSFTILEFKILETFKKALIQKNRTYTKIL